VPVQPTPTAQRRQLGIELRQLREAAGLRIEPVAQYLYCSPSKISRIETGRGTVSLRDVRDLLEVYHASAEQQDALFELARGARARSWLHAYSDLHPSVFVGLEASASSISIYQALLIPGMLQTAEYARTVLHAIRPNLGPEAIERWVALWKERQALLWQAEPPALLAILDEAVMRRPIGGRHVMQEQLSFLVKAAEWPSVTLQILPFAHGEHACLNGPFTILSFSGASQPDLVYIEEDTRELYLEGPEEVRRYTEAFDRARNAALKPDDSVELIRTVVAGLSQ
jgi:transcriptional regulator with XRE-family HTH domain